LRLSRNGADRRRLRHRRPPWAKSRYRDACRAGSSQTTRKPTRAARCHDS
jgi:hypothetical protein